MTIILWAEEVKVGLCASDSWSPQTTCVLLFPSPLRIMNGLSKGITTFSLYACTNNCYIHFHALKIKIKLIYIYLLFFFSIIVIIIIIILGGGLKRRTIPVNSWLDYDRNPVLIVWRKRIYGRLYSLEIAITWLVHYDCTETTCFLVSSYSVPLTIC